MVAAKHFLYKMENHEQYQNANYAPYPSYLDLSPPRKYLVTYGTKKLIAIQKGCVINILK